MEWLFRREWKNGFDVFGLASCRCSAGGRERESKKASWLLSGKEDCRLEIILPQDDMMRVKERVDGWNGSRVVVRLCVRVGDHTNTILWRIGMVHHL
jgi:hypothetical protein